MRIALLALLAILATTATIGAVFAADEDLTYRAFDISVLTRPRVPQWGSQLGMLGSNHVFAERDNPGASDPFLTPREVRTAITTTIVPESWEMVDGASLQVEEDTVLHVRNREAIVKQVGAWLYAMAAQAQARVFLALDVTDGQGDRLHSASLDASPGILSWVKSTRCQQYVVDFEVEIAQGSNISNPIIYTPEEGLVGEIRATPMLDGTHVLVEGIVQRGRYTQVRSHTLGIDEECIKMPFRSEFRSHAGTLELPTFDLTNLHWTAVVRSGEVVEIPVSWKGQSQTFRTRVEAPSAPGETPVLELAHLTRPNLPFRVGSNDYYELQRGMGAPYPSWVEASRDLPLASLETLADLTHQIVDPEGWEERESLKVIGQSRLLVPPQTGLRDRITELLMAREQAAIRPVILDLKAYSVALDAPIGPGATVEPGQAQLVAGGRMPTIAGRMTTIQIGSTMNFLADYDVEVAQEARIADPIVGQSFEGLAANLRPRFPRESRFVTVEAEMLLSFRTLDPEPIDLNAQYLGPLDRVTTRRSVVNQTLQIPRGGTYVIDLGPDPKDPTRKLVAELGVTVP